VRLLLVTEIWRCFSGYIHNGSCPWDHDTYKSAVYVADDYGYPELLQGGRWSWFPKTPLL
jgi:hypothetical protein